MQRNDFNKRIDIYTLTSVDDGFGGNYLDEVLATSSWANVKTIKAGANAQDFGITEQDKAVIFTVRFRNDLDYNVNNMYIKYRGLKYTISTAPTNLNFSDAFVSFVGVQETVKSND